MLPLRIPSYLMEHLLRQIANVNGFAFNLAGRPYRWVPTLEYTVAFLYEKLNINAEEGQAVMAKIENDDRIDKVMSK